MKTYSKKNVQFHVLTGIAALQMFMLFSGILLAIAEKTGLF
jgi:hypothetical protein